MGAESRIARLAAGVVFLAAPVVAREISVRIKDHKVRKIEIGKIREQEREARETCEDNCNCGDSRFDFTKQNPELQIIA